MDEKQKEQFVAALATHSQAQVRNLIAAEQAILRGQFNVAKVLRAAAHSQRVIAMQIARQLNAADHSEELLQTILAELSRLDDLDNVGNIGAAKNSVQDVVGRSIDSLQNNSDVLERDVAQMIWGCYQCGTLIEGDPPHACPTCGAMSAEFEWFGPFYSHTAEHLGQLQPAEIISILNAIPDQVTAATLAIDDAILRRKPSPDEWSAKEIVAHMLETDRLFYQRATVILESQGTPPLPRPAPPWKLHEGKGYETMPITAILDRLRDARQLTLDLLTGLQPADWSRTGVNQGAATSLIDLGTWLANHDRGHLAQIKKLVMP